MSVGLIVEIIGDASKLSSALGKEAPLWGCLLMAADEARSRLRHQLRAAAG